MQDIEELSDNDLEQVVAGKNLVRIATIATLGYFQVKEALARFLR